MSIVIFFSRLRYNFDGIVDTTTGRIAATKTSAKRFDVDGSIVLACCGRLGRS